MGETTVTVREYLKEQAEFINKHSVNGSCEVHTKHLECGGYSRKAQWQDGAFWIETTMPVIETKTIEAHGIVVKANVKLWRTEYWSSESTDVKCFYEQD